MHQEKCCQHCNRASDDGACASCFLDSGIGFSSGWKGMMQLFNAVDGVSFTMGIGCCTMFPVMGKNLMLMDCIDYAY